MTNVHRELLRDALWEINVHSASAFSWLGERFECPPSEVNDNSGPHEFWLRRELEARLYADFYCTGGIAPASSNPGSVAGDLRPGVLTDLSSANRGTGCRMSVEILDLDDRGDMVIGFMGMKIWVPRDRAVSRTELRIGGSVDVLFPNESLGAAEGFYTAFGNDGTVQSDAPGGVDRFYWNVRPDARWPMVDLATGSLNRGDLPFRFKMSTASECWRCDGAVLYTRRVDRGSVLRLLSEIAVQTSNMVRDRTPAFTKPLAKGLAFAEDPPNDESFGTNRCRLVAEGLVRAMGSGGDDLHRLEIVEAAFRESGLSLDRPYLNPGSSAGLEPEWFHG